MSARKGDFIAATKQALARRSGFRCSFPGCGAPTSGPSEEADTATSNTGMACHIVAASDGPQARRVEPKWNASQLSAVSNGIWMCHTHGKLIDTDECSYTVEVLKTWRHLSELRARLSQELGVNIGLGPTFCGQHPMPQFSTVILKLDAVSRSIGDSIEASCMPQIWGEKLSRALRDVLIEVAQNAITHGKAAHVTLEILPKSVRLIDNGKSFDPMQLHGIPGGGGSLSVKYLLKDFGRSLYHSYNADDQKNCLEFSWVRSQDEIRALTTCTAEVPVEVFWGEEVRFEMPKNCKKIYLMFPPYFAMSWALQMPKIIGRSVPKGQEVVFVGEDLSDGVVEVLKREIPNGSVINFERSTE